ncbi:hypothetical protein BDQ12DRAFT_686205 [Crucibulum laeve]|uniref:GDP-fucose protein O-fucosyltransferase-domain-containing protein n=1 Tax=Crucibulum laeve TaxID=68775 RepID=A0A5C3LW05_9AGAR|nr:hypothetical protein BDQ12DRAFT_686205 [Crucibulum laeve]
MARQPSYSPSSSSPSASSSFLPAHSDDRQPFIANTDKEYPPSSYTNFTKFRPRRRYIYSIAAALTAASLFALLIFGFWTSNAEEESFNLPEDATLQAEHDDVQEFPQSVVIGEPTEKFRDNLQPNLKYITSWISAGWTNDVMTYANLIYLGLLTERIPVVPMFVPSHIGGSVPPIDFGEVFDVPRLSKAIRLPVVEWHQVKNRSSEALDELGCWNIWQAVQEDEKRPRWSIVPQHLKLDISYTTVPSWVKVIPGYRHDLHAWFWSLAALAFPETRAENLVTPLESPTLKVSLPPDEQMLCYDYLYYVCANQPYEFDFDYSPAWRFVGRHMRWVPKLEQLADTYVRKATGIEDGKPTPPWIAIHVRHGDFKNWCNDVGIPLKECFASLPVIARRVEEVKAELKERKGIDVEHVIMTSDERDPEWWSDVVKMGWFGIDHSKTVEEHGAWYPVLIDAVIQSSGAGFVGTDRSTMSTLARRRVQSWRDGVVRTVKWGKPDSDDH